MKEIYYTHKEGDIVSTCTVDDEDYDYLTTLSKWECHSGDYFKYRERDKNRKTIMMHRVIYERHFGKIPEGMVIDHIDRNILNNQKANLRLATKRQNCLNSKVRSNNLTTGYTRSAPDNRTGRFRASINEFGVHKHIGMFDTARDAAIAFDLVAQKSQGDFFRPNIVDKTAEEIKRISDLVFNAKRLDGKSQYRCVGLCKDGETWEAYSHEERKTKALGRFFDERDAAILADYYRIQSNKNSNELLLNFPDIEKSEYDRVFSKRNEVKEHRKNTVIRGVRFNKGKWEACLEKRHYYEYLGRFDSKKEALEAYNKRATEVFGDKATLNAINEYTLREI